jgi:hypothetical protein
MVQLKHIEKIITSNQIHHVNKKQSNENETTEKTTCFIWKDFQTAALEKTKTQ